MAGDINRVTIVGRLTRDPELRALSSGSSVLQLGVAVNGRQKDATGNWVDKPNFFDVKVFGAQAEMLVNHLSKGRRVGVDGIIRTVIGTGVQGFAGDGGPASQARLNFPTGLTAGAGGGLRLGLSS